MASATLLALLVAAFGAAPAGAASTASCAKQVIADWYDNNRVDRIYPLRCYRQAIKLLPVDVRVYSGAEPAPTWLNVPACGVLWPQVSAPQHLAVPSVPSPQVWSSPAASRRYVPTGGVLWPSAL